MIILSIDSSSPVASVACVRITPGGDGGDEVLFRWDKPHRRSDSAALFLGLQESVGACGIPDSLCVGLGPGSYNGLRAGIAAARGFATALNLPLRGIPSPLSLPGPASGFWALGDARGGHYWVACVQGDAFLESPRLITPQDVLAHLATHPGFPALSATSLPDIESTVLATPDAVRLALLFQKSDPCELTPEPMYLKPPHITTPRTAPIAS
jgi:tRNA threonylcarbamoyladenosine biosynthesis protein TsaB